MNPNQDITTRSFLAIIGLALGAAALQGGCASTAPQPTSMTNAQADFSAYKSFGLEPNTSGQPLSLVEQNIRAAITKEMKAQGLRGGGSGYEP